VSSVESAQLDEESKGLLRRIVERTAYRQLMAVNIRGHGLKYVTAVEEKRAITVDLESALDALGVIDALYEKIGGSELTFVVRDLMERVPYPYSMLELATCLALVDRTERLVLESYLESRSGEMARIARSLLDADRPGTRLLEGHLARFCVETGNRPTAQQFLNRWMTIAIVAFGRPGSPGDQRAVALGLRSRRVEDMVRRFQDELKPFVTGIGLAMPSPSSLGIEVVS
jgi:1,2-phenylacetyl-CoA epoxidase catalytic subunit